MQSPHDHTATAGTAISKDYGERPAYFVHYASEIFDLLGVAENNARHLSVERAIAACHSMNIPVRSHFRIVYRSGENSVSEDWRLSSFACALLSLNSDPHSISVARIQLELLRNFIQ